MNDGGIQLAAAVGLAIAAAVLVLAALSRRKRKSGPPVDQAAADLNELTGQLDALAKQLDGKVDQALRRLDEALAAVDAKTRQLLSAADAMDGDEQEERAAAGQLRAPTRKMEILRLAGEGLDAVEIARRMKMNVGEVELLLGLLKIGKKQTSNAK